jgi:hypothetical protein
VTFQKNYCLSIHDNQPRCLPKDEWIIKMCSIYIMESYSVIKKAMKLCHLQEDGWSGDHHVKRNEPDSERQKSCFLLYVESRYFLLKNDMKVEEEYLGKRKETSGRVDGVTR